MMSKHSLIKLGVVTLVAVIAAFAINRSRQPVSEFSNRATPLVAGLGDRVNDVNRLVLTTANAGKVVELVRGEKGWSVQERGGYAADVGKLREYLLKLSNANLIEQKTANKDRYADLGVSDVSEPAAKGVEVRIEGLDEPFRFIAGIFNAQGGGTYVRRSDEAQSWLANGNLIPEQAPADWLKKELADIPAQRIAAVSIVPAKGKPLRISKQSEDAASYTIADIPKGREPSSEFAANGPAGVLADLRIEDVAPAAEKPAPDSATRVRYETFDGIVVEALAWQEGDKHYATFDASLDEARATAHVETAKPDSAADAAEDEKPATTETAAEAGASEAADDAAPAAAPPDPAADRAQRMAALRTEVEQLDAAFSGWAFVLPAYKAGNMTKAMDDLLKPLEDASAKKSADASG